MSNLKNNLKLWKNVEETEIKYTKKAQKGQHHFTSITPMSQFKKATKAWNNTASGSPTSWNNAYEPSAPRQLLPS